MLWWCATNEHIGQTDYTTFVKCKIVKVNKRSITVQKYWAILDASDEYRAIREQTHGTVYLHWTNDLTDKKHVCFDTKNLRTKGDAIYENSMKTSEASVDFGN